MSEIAQAVEQDEIASSLVGDSEEQQTVEQTGTEQQEVVQDEQTVDAEGEQEEVAEDWLPTDQDKVFPDETYAQYAERRYPDLVSALSDANISEPTRVALTQLLHDKINADIYIRQQQQAEFQEEETEEVQEPTQTQPQVTREQWFQNLDRVIQETTDPEVAKSFHGDFLRAFGVPEAEIAKMPPQQAIQFTNVASKYMLNLISTHLPNLLQAQLPQQVSQAFPGFGEMYERSSYAMAWDQVRNSNPQFSSLPAYGTKEFSKTLREAAAKIPGFDEMQFTDGKGKPLPPSANAQKKYTMLAQAASGQNVDPALLQKAAAAGASNARRAAVRRSAGNLGSGQSKGASSGNGASKFQTNTDLFDDDAMALYHREHGRL